ncbi:hypothetical protein K457DRAFT_129560 [Linnemannia elongata AG-77]|uniref:Uncharacterized protein n=1 Tax=Linnemannia elongata AG-77 TaxID=1314771 RepID=A0A197JIF3_9FUNG|nr:hypothetical protein K457DRAFT_129560 [Linnemannia elongata AG-77]
MSEAAKDSGGGGYSTAAYKNIVVVLDVINKLGNRGVGGLRLLLKVVQERHPRPWGWVVTWGLLGLQRCVKMCDLALGNMLVAASAAVHCGGGGGIGRMGGSGW